MNIGKLHPNQNSAHPSLSNERTPPHKSRRLEPVAPAKTCPTTEPPSVDIPSHGQACGPAIACTHPFGRLSCSPTESKCLGYDLPLGAACTNSVECRGACAGGVCVGAAEDAPCSHNDACLSTYCASGRCKPLPTKPTAACVSDFACGGGRRCYGGQCAASKEGPAAKEGEPCTAGLTRCTDGLCGSDGTCLPFFSLPHGAPAPSALACASQFLTDSGVCGRPATRGVFNWPCITDWDCGGESNPLIACACTPDVTDGDIARTCVYTGPGFTVAPELLACAKKNDIPISDVISEVQTQPLNLLDSPLRTKCKTEFWAHFCRSHSNTPLSQHACKEAGDMSAYLSHRCTNGVQDEGESDQDCGGSCFHGCGLERTCVTGSDCTTNICSLLSLRCRIAPDAWLPFFCFGMPVGVAFVAIVAAAILTVRHFKNKGKSDATVVPAATAAGAGAGLPGTATAIVPGAPTSTTKA